MALQDLATAAGVPIVVDPNVAGDVFVSFENVSLDEALELMLAGKPYVFKKMPRYYLVAGRSLTSQAFPDISETRRVRLNYIAARTGEGDVVAGLCSVRPGRTPECPGPE